ncbi:MAG: hypothetical protein KDI92_12815 [Xanthomonadales bacterium]|nr:hypothetical protein [Xanthomonadales bacterium]
MNPKKLAMLFYGFIAAMVLLAIYLLYFQQQQAKKQATNTANVVSQDEMVASVKHHQEASPRIVNIQSIQDKSVTRMDKTIEVDSLSYLDVYQQLQTARACQMFYRFWQANGLDADITQRVSRPVYQYGQPVYAATEQVPLTSEQNDTLEYWVIKCYQLWQDYGVFDTSKTDGIPLNDVVDAISIKLSTITAKTSKEQTLKKTRQLASQWAVSYQALEQAYEGDDSLEPTAAQALYDELAALQQLDDEVKNQWFAAQRNNQPDEESLRDQHFDLLRQIKAIENRIKEQKMVNHEKLMQAQLDFQGFDQAMNQALRTQDADVFFEVVYALNGKRTFAFHFLGFEHHSTYSRPADKHRITPDQMVFTASGLLQPSTNHGELRYAFHLYLCELGWDCGPLSPIVMNYCLLGPLSSYPDACGRNLSQFYQEHFISPNRWQDVMMFKLLYKELFYE